MSSVKTKDEPTECDVLAQMTDFQEILEHEMLGCPVCLRIKARNALGNQVPNVQASTSKMEEKPVHLTEKFCKELENITDFQERLEHEMMGCPVCIRIKTQKALGQEVEPSADNTRNLINYGDQAVKPVNMRFNRLPARNPQMSMKSNERKRRTDSDDPLELKKRAHDKMIVRDLVRMEGLDKKEAALKLVEQKRRPKINEGDRIAPDQMPWQPNMNILHLPREFYSCLLPVDHRRYVAIISNFLSTVPNFRFDMNKLEIEAMDDRLKEERERFIKEAFDAVKHWKKSPFRYQAVGSRDFFDSRESSKYKMVLGSSNFSEKVSSVDWPRLYHRDDQMPNPNFRLIVSEILQSGKQLRIHIPDVRRKCEYNMNPSVIEQHFALEPAVKIPIEKDEKAVEWAMEKGIEFLMDGSTVRHLMSNRWPNRNQTFANRVSVVQRVKKGSIQRVVFVSKPLLASQLEVLYLTRQFIKWTAKCELRKKFVPNSSKLRTSKATLREMLTSRREPEVKSEHNAEPTTVSDINMEISDESSKKTKFQISGIEESDDEECPLQIEETFELINRSPVTASSSAPVNQSAALKPRVEENDILGGILDSMGLNVNSQSFSTEITGQPQDFTDITQEEANHTDAYKTKRYSVMRFDKEGKHEILVRTSNHGVDQNGIPVSVTIKTEYLPEIGSDKLHLEEELWNLVTGIVKDSAEQCNLHIHPRIGHCLQIKRISGNLRTCNLSSELKQLLESRTARMCVLMDSLEKLEAGEYLIFPEGNSMTILREVEELNPSEIPSDEVEFERGTKVYNCTSIARKSLMSSPRFSNDLARNWNGLNPHFPLVWHITAGRIPGSLYPRRRNDLNWRPDEQFRKNNRQSHRGRGSGGRGNRGGGRGNHGDGRGSHGGGRGNLKNVASNTHIGSSDLNEMMMEQD